MERAIQAFEDRGVARALALRGKAQAAGDRVARHAQREVARMLDMQVPGPARDPRAVFTVAEFAERTVAAAQRAVREQAKLLREAVAKHQEGESLRRKMLDQLWLLDHRAKLVARSEPEKLQAQFVQFWAQNTGGTHYIWVTARDEAVRPGHAALDGKTCSWASPPSTGRGRTAHPGQEPNCRCKALPVQATYE